MKIDRQVTSSFQLIATQIVSVRLSNSFLQMSEKTETKTSCEYETEVFDFSKTATGAVNLTVSVEITNPENEQEHLNLDIEVAGGFLDPTPVNEEKFVSMLEINGCAALYAFARAQISNLISQSVMSSSYVLPLTNIYRLKERKEQEAESKE